MYIYLIVHHVYLFDSPSCVFSCFDYHHLNILDSPSCIFICFVCYVYLIIFIFTARNVGQYCEHWHLVCVTNSGGSKGGGVRWGGGGVLTPPPPLSGKYNVLVNKEYVWLATQYVTLRRPRICLESLLEHFIFLHFLGGGPPNPPQGKVATHKYSHH